jgi:hypothetical protein
MHVAYIAAFKVEFTRIFLGNLKSDMSPNGTTLTVCFVALACISLYYAAGKLPFFTHGHAAVSFFLTIIYFASSLAKSTTSGARDLDASLSAEQRGKRTAWCSHVETNIGDLMVSSYLCAPFKG